MAPPCRGTEEGVDPPGGDRGEEVGLRGADEPDRRRGAVLLVVGVQDQQRVDGLGHDRVDLVGLRGEAERHAQEVLHQAQRVVRVEERLADGLLVGVGRDGEDLGHQAHRRQLDGVVVERVEAVLVEGGQRADRARQDRHRVASRGEAVEEALEVLVQQGVPADVAGERVELRLRGQLAVDEQVADLEEAGPLGQLLDRDAPPVPQDAGVAVDVGDRGRTGGGAVETRIERGQAGLAEEFADVDRSRALGRGMDRHLELAAWVVQDSAVAGGLGCHVEVPSHTRGHRLCVNPLATLDRRSGSAAPERGGRASLPPWARTRLSRMRGGRGSARTPGTAR